MSQYNVPYVNVSPASGVFSESKAQAEQISLLDAQVTAVAGSAEQHLNAVHSRLADLEQFKQVSTDELGVGEQIDKLINALEASDISMATTIASNMSANTSATDTLTSQLDQLIKFMGTTFNMTQSNGEALVDLASLHIPPPTH